ncbi:LamG domain-containing protein, partial [Bacteroides xylanisolvens]
MKRIYTYMCLLLLSVLSFAVTGCDDDDDDDVAKDLIELIVNKPVIRIGQNEEAKVNVVVGNGNYTVRSFNTAIATATVSGELITVKSGSQNGATTVEVMDGEGVVAN